MKTAAEGKIRIVILQNSEGTPPGSVIDWLESRGYRPDLRRLYSGDQLPKVEDFDWVMSLGGSMNVDETETHPWLALEKEFLREAIKLGKTCLGLCLGGQLLAQVLGAKVAPNKHWEVGWFPVRLSDGSSIRVFQFHQDQFGLPQGARRIATNEITENQGFLFTDRVVGLQFHPEATETWIEECADERPYPSGPFVQSPDELRTGTALHLAEMRSWFFKLLEDLEMKTPAGSSGRTK